MLIFIYINTNLLYLVSVTLTSMEVLNLKSVFILLILISFKQEKFICSIFLINFKLLYLTIIFVVFKFKTQ